jgi:hypothetical protein
MGYHTKVSMHGKKCKQQNILIFFKKPTSLSLLLMQRLVQKINTVLLSGTFNLLVDLIPHVRILNLKFEKEELYVTLIDPNMNMLLKYIEKLKDGSP